MATTNPPSVTGSSGDASIETLRKLKEIEAEVAGETQRVRAQAQAELDRLRADAETQVQQAKTDAERLRAVSVQAAHSEVNLEVEKLLAEGRNAADGIPHRTGKELDAFKDRTLDLLFGEFRTSGGKSSE
jgi:vacuolar-type H+-ATPase subunit H